MLRKIVLLGLIAATSTTYAASATTDVPATDIAANMKSPAASKTIIAIAQQSYPLPLKKLKIVGAPSEINIESQQLIASFNGQLVNQNQLQQLAEKVQKAYAKQGLAVSTINVPTQSNDGTLIMSLRTDSEAPSTWNLYSSSRDKTADKPNLFLVPTRSASNFVNPGSSTIVKEDGVSAHTKIDTDGSQWKSSPAVEKANTAAVHTVQHYPLTVQRLELINALPQVSIDTQALLAPFHGQIKSDAQLSALAQSVRAAYKDQGIGFVNIDIPTQNNTGTIVLNLGFGRILKTTLRGNSGHSTSWMQYYLDQMKSVYPLKRSSIERYTLLMDALPGIDINTLAEPQMSADNVMTGINVIAVSDYSPLTGYMSLANGNSDYLGPYQVQGGFTWNQPTGPDAFGIDAIKSAPVANELTYYDTRYNRFLTKDDLELGLFYSHVDTQPGGALSSYNIKGQGDTGRLTLTQPWILTKNLRFSNSFIFSHMHADSVYNALNLESYNDRVTTMALRTNLGFKQGNSWNQMSLLLSLGEPWLGTPENPTNASTIGATGRFFKTQVDFTRTQYLTTNFSVIAGMTGQYTRNSLFSSEQLNYGNTLYGRAYTSSGLAGDNGYMGRLQTNYNLRGLSWSLQGISPYAFYDVGELYDNHNSLVASERYSAASAGIGINSVLSKKWYLDFYMAKPLTHDVDANVQTDARWVFSITGVF